MGVVYPCGSLRLAKWKTCMGVGRMQGIKVWIHALGFAAIR
jgi:hypothetical protein